MAKPRSAHHREKEKDAWVRRRADALRRLSGPGRVLERLIADMTPIGINTFHIRAGAILVLRAKTALDEWRPLAEDETGEAWR
jgi:hypothetical protein